MADAATAVGITPGAVAAGSEDGSRNRRARVGYGTWGSRLFQSIYSRSSSVASTLPLMPEWRLVVAALAGLSAMRLLWAPLLLALPPLLLAVGMLVVGSIGGGLRARLPGTVSTLHERARMRALISLLFAVQPVARLAGRLRHGLAPWRRRRSIPPALPRPIRLRI